MKNLYSRQKHLFACYHANISSKISQMRIGQEILIADTDLIHRLITVLRLGISEQVILFDRSVHGTFTLKAIAKHKSITFVMDEKSENQIFKPTIHFLLPILKKESLELSLYALCELGVNKISLVTTQKSQHKWSDKEHERAQKIIIAAAEQSKNFSFPELMPPVELQELLPQVSHSHKLFFDPEGTLLSLQMDAFVQSQSFCLAIGPEGDLTCEEKEQLKQCNFEFIALTPSVLRSSQAAALGAGIIRSLFR